MMDELDGNGAAGLLREIFGTEMTVAVATCATCGAVAQIGGSRLYMGGPGTVVRCRSCEGVLVVITQVRGRYCVDLMGIGELVMPLADMPPRCSSCVMLMAG
jgi:hypothetical protein